MKSAHDFWDSGVASSWFDGVDDIVHNISKSVCGPEFVRLAGITGAPDVNCIEMFKEGAPLLGALPCSGWGVGRDLAPNNSIDSLR